MNRLLWLALVGLIAISPLSAQEPSLRSTLKGHTQVVHSVAFSPDGKTLASGSTDNTIKLWDVVTGKNVTTLQGDFDAESVMFTPDGKTLASGGWANRVKLWDVASGKNTVTIKTATTAFALLAFSPDGNILAIAYSSGKAIKLWNMATGKYIATFNNREDINCIAFSPDGKKLVSWSWDTIKLWDMASQKNIETWDVDIIKNLPKNFQHPHQRERPNWSMAFSPDGKTLALAMSWDKSIRLWDVASGKNTATLNGDGDATLCLAYSPDGKTLASGCGLDHPVIKLWDLAGGKNTVILKGHTHDVVSVAFSSDGRILASGSWDKTIRLWDMAPLKEMKTTE